MAMQPAICVNCGGQIEVDDIDLNGYGECLFCHTRYKVIDVITIDGLPTVKSLLITAIHSMEDGNYEKAVKDFNKTLEIKPNCHEAWWGLYICNSYFDSYYNYKDKYGNSGPLTKAQIMGTTFQKYAARAIEYAPKDIAEKYQNETAETRSFIEAAKRGDFDIKTKGKSGCYIATTIYGSYDCDEVVKLRRFRDEHLAKSVLGRCFIRVYYKLSPAFSRYIHTESKLRIKIRRFLDGVVSRMF
jgi:tetratricopeptide (TPR) repeat protein